MTNRTAMLGLVALTLLAACSKQAPAPAAGNEAPAPAAAVEPPPAPTYDSARLAEMATGMLALVDEAPQCQAFRDQLQAIADAPAGAPPAVSPTSIVVQANEAGCAKKAAK